MNAHHVKPGFIFALFLQCITGMVNAQYEAPLANHALTITQQPADIQACPGETVRFSVGTTSTDLQYQWKRGAIALADNARISGTRSPLLTISPVDHSDAGNDYHCVISDHTGQTITTHFVSLFQNIPVITFEPTPILVDEGGEATLSVTAAGNNLRYQWMKGPMSLIDGEFISGTTSPALTLSSVSMRDIGDDYYVVVYSGCPVTDTSARASIKADPSGAFYNPADHPAISPEINLGASVNIPGGFSPNGDGINDLFMVDGIETYPNNRLLIYNQEGKLVLEMEDYQNTWNGKLSGEFAGSDLPEGTYFYILDLEDGGVPLKGSIYIRK
jgi:gliding motility-associated-like protein